MKTRPLLSILILALLASCDSLPLRSSSEKAEESETFTYYTTTVDNLSQREFPNLQSRIINRIGEGEKVEFLNETTDFTERVELRGRVYNEPWVKVDYQGQTGWVYRGGLSAAGAPIEPLQGELNEPPPTRRFTPSSKYELSDFWGLWQVDLKTVDANCAGRYEGEVIIEKWRIERVNFGEIIIRSDGTGTNFTKYQGDYDAGYLRGSYEKRTRLLSNRPTSSASFSIVITGDETFEGSRFFYDYKTGCSVEYHVEGKRF